MSRLSFLINREDKRLSNSVVDILNMLEMGESVDMIASDMNSKTTNIRRIIRENDIGQDTISTTLQWRKAIKRLLPDREAHIIRWNESKESAIPYKLCVPKHFFEFCRKRSCNCDSCHCHAQKYTTGLLWPKSGSNSVANNRTTFAVRRR